MKFISLILCVLIISPCRSQEKTAIYSNFDPGLTKINWKIEMQDKSAVTITANLAKPATLKRALFSTKLPNFYYVEISDVVPDRKEKGFAIVEYGDKMLTLYHENIFSSVAEIEKLLEKKDSLEYFPAIYLVKDISLSQAQKLPAVTSITDEKLGELRKLNAARKVKVQNIPKNLEFKKRLKIFVKQHFWLDAQLLMLGYKRNNAEESKFILKKLQ